MTLGCLAFHLWRMADPSPPNGLPPGPRAREVEAAVLGARLPAGFGTGQELLFLPLTLTGFSALTASGPAERRLGAWIAGAQQATLSALLMLKRQSDRQAGAIQATTDLSGRTPARPIDCLVRWPQEAWRAKSPDRAGTGSGRQRCEGSVANPFGTEISDRDSAIFVGLHCSAPRSGAQADESSS